VIRVHTAGNAIRQAHTAVQPVREMTTIQVFGSDRSELGKALRPAGWAIIFGLLQNRKYLSNTVYRALSNAHSEYHCLSNLSHVRV